MAATPGLRAGGRVISLDRPVVFGIVNVTPDSFSDGGRHFSTGAAVAHAEALLAEGADGLDIGGESTRPAGAVPVDAAEEMRRVVPVVRELARRFAGAPISVDTTKSDVAAAALDAGATIVNDVSAFRLDPRMAQICAERGAAVVLMHSRGGVADMATFAHAAYGTDPVGEMVAELARAVSAARSAGIAAEAIVVDPGIGFAKRPAESLRAIAELPRFAALGFPVMVGVSRKRFIGEITGVQEPAARVHGTTGANVAALDRGARLFRVHEAGAARQALDVAWAVRSAGGTR
jgi:dihydropteroate synthase